MSNQKIKGKTLVTGGSGYIGSWIIRLLLEDGNQVATTVRSLKNQSKIQHLLELKEKYSDKLEFFEADLLAPGSFKEAMQGCEVVLHTASPFQIKGIKDAQKQLVDPAVAGTRNVLDTVNETESVKRVVVTSSVASVVGDNEEALSKKDNTFSEADWNETSSLDHNPYPYSKVMAEKEAWKMAEAQSRWTMATINPAFVLGPSLSNRVDSTSIEFMMDMLKGRFQFGVPELYLGVVDVRNVARAHIQAGAKTELNGRFLLTADTMSLLQIGRKMKALFPKQPLPSGELPKFVLYIGGPLQGFSWKYISKNMGFAFKVDNSRSKNELGVEYLSIDDTFREHGEQLFESGLLKRK